MRKLSLILIGCLLTQPLAAASERSQFRMSATVKTVCRGSFSSGTIAAPEAGRLELGLFTQLCNSRTGFRIAMQHPTGLDGSHLTLGGRVIPLSVGTETIIVDYSGPAFRVEHATLVLADAADIPTALSFRVIPKGPVY